MKRVQLKRREAAAPQPVLPPAHPSAVPSRRNLDLSGATFLLEEKISPPYPAGWTLQLYDIGVPGQLRAVYPDCSQIHPLAWHRHRLTVAGVDFSHLEPPRVTKGEQELQAEDDVVADVVNERKMGKRERAPKAPPAPAAPVRVKLRIRGQ